jgi:hypothetical protein
MTFSIGGVAGEGYGYLKSTMWWSGMILSKVELATKLNEKER